MKSLVLAMTALSLAAAPTVASAQEEVAAGSVAGETTIGSFLIPLLAISAVLLGTYVAIEESDDEPVSP